MPSLPSFHVRNLGPILEGTVQLHPLTILIGKNNTGKTYMAQAIYAAFKALERANGPIEQPITVEESYEFLSRLHDTAALDAEVLPDPLREKAESWVNSRLGRVGRDLKERLTVYFDVADVDELKKWGSTEPLVVSAMTSEFGDEPSCLFGLQNNIASNARLPRLTRHDFEDSYIFEVLSDLTTERPDEHDERDSMRNHRAWYMLTENLWYAHLLPSVGLSGKAHYLPAGRSGLLEAWTDVVRLRLEQDRERLALTGREPPVLGGIALDFLLGLQELIGPSRRHRFRRVSARRRQEVEAVEAVEATALHLEALIDGDIGLARGREQVPSLTYTQGDKSVPVQRASSMVAELAPLLSWIKHLLSPGDLLLLDEPEAHMHPEAVLAVAQTLVALSRSGVTVLCTTHSSEFLHQVSNCMLRAALPLPGDDPTTETARISVEDIGVYRFERGDSSSGTRVVPVEIDPDWGIPEDEHVAVAEQLADETAKLIESLSEQHCPD